MSDAKCMFLRRPLGPPWNSFSSAGDATRSSPTILGLPFGTPNGNLGFKIELCRRDSYFHTKTSILHHQSTHLRTWAPRGPSKIIQNEYWGPRGTPRDPSTPQWIQNGPQRDPKKLIFQLFRGCQMQEKQDNYKERIPSKGRGPHPGRG